MRLRASSRASPLLHQPVVSPRTVVGAGSPANRPTLPPNTPVIHRRTRHRIHQSVPSPRTVVGAGSPANRPDLPANPPSHPPPPPHSSIGTVATHHRRSGFTRERAGTGNTHSNEKQKLHLGLWRDRICHSRHLALMEMPCRDRTVPWRSRVIPHSHAGIK